MSFKDGCYVIRRRGIYMEQAVPEGQGSMAAVSGLSAKQTEEVLKTSLDTAKIGIANYNCPGQIVISGEKGEVERAAEVLKRRRKKSGAVKGQRTVSFPVALRRGRTASKRTRKDFI